MQERGGTNIFDTHGGWGGAGDTFATQGGTTIFDTQGGGRQTFLTHRGGQTFLH